MKTLRFFLLVSTIIIYLFTVLAIKGYGFNWPAVAIGDLVSMNWRSQFDVDLIIHLLLLAAWIVWREGVTVRGYVFGVLSVLMGGMFSFPYIIYSSLEAEGNISKMLLGVHAKST